MHSTLPPTLIDINLNKRPLWLTLSKATLKSSWTILYTTPSLFLRTSECDAIWLAVIQCSPGLSYKQTEEQAKNHISYKKLESLWVTNFSYTFDRIWVIDMGRWFSLSGDGAPLGMAVTLGHRQHSGNDPWRISPRKIMFSFEAIISATIFRNRGNTPKGSTPPCVSRSRIKQT